MRSGSVQKRQTARQRAVMRRVCSTVAGSASVTGPPLASGSAARPRPGRPLLPFGRRLSRARPSAHISSRNGGHVAQPFAAASGRGGGLPSGRTATERRRRRTPEGAARPPGGLMVGKWAAISPAGTLVIADETEDGPPGRVGDARSAVVHRLILPLGRLHAAPVVCDCVSNTLHRSEERRWTSSDRARRDLPPRAPGDRGRRRGPVRRHDALPNGRCATSSST